MRILITSGIFPPDIGGPASYVPKIASEFSKRGNKVTVLCLSENKYDDLKFNFDVVRIKRKKFLPIRVLITIVKIISISLKSDIIYANTLTFESSIGAILSRKPIIHKIVGDYAWERARNKGYYLGTIDQYQKSKKNLKLNFLDFYFKFFLRFSKNIITPSNYLKKIVLGWNPTLKVSTIYNAVDFPKTLERKRRKTLSKILTVSRLVNWKNIDQIILSLNQLEDFTLEIVGEGPEKENLQSLVIEHELENRVNFLGQLTRNEVYKCMVESDVFILNSSYEGLPHVIVEAMYAKIPVICSNVGGCSEIVKDSITGFLTNKKQDIIYSIEKLKNEKLRELVVNQAFDFVNSDFNFQKMFDSTQRTLS